MSTSIPKAIISASHSSFALINPATEKFHRRLDRHGYLTAGLRRHIAISYVWSEWKEKPSDRLPNWAAIRESLLSVVGPAAPSGLRAETWKATSCWIDCKCIDQDSDADKDYWIPRMDEVYGEARCTVLLVRTHDLTVLQGVAQDMTCPFKGKLNSVDEFLAPHNCLLSQGCTLLPHLEAEQVQRCLDVLRSFTAGLWRRRAWILQEVLLSQNYLLSWSPTGWMSLADVGVIAGGLFRDYPKETWLGDFAHWCRHLWYLRQNYGEAQTFELCDANVLQLAAGLEATVPADKFYALCGILRLKVQYDARHSADEAFQNVISELVRKGRLSWLYAIRPPIQGNEIELRSNSLAPFVLTRLNGRLMANRQKMEMTKSDMLVTVNEIGTTIWTQSLREFLNQAVTLFKTQKGFNYPSELSHLVYAPAVIRRLALDAVEPIMTTAIMDTICKGIGIRREMGPPSTRAAAMILCLFGFDKILPEQERPELNPDIPTIRRAKAASWSIQSRIYQVIDSFSVVKFAVRAVEGDDKVPQQQSQKIALAFSTVSIRSTIYSVKDDKGLLLAAEPTGVTEDETNYAVFRGMLFQLNVSEVLGPVSSSLFHSEFWKIENKDTRKLYLRFPYTSSSRK